MFGRRTAKKSEPESVEEPTVRPDGKGRPTPKRSDAEAARKKRMTTPRTRKEAAAVQRQRARSEREKRMKAMQSGDERYLPARDRGPVRRFVRDFVDSRRTVGEFMLPVLVLILLLSLVSPTATWSVRLTSLGFVAVLVLIPVDSMFLTWRLNRELKRRFPDTSTRGAKLYALLRSTNMRFMRMPKPQVKVGQKLPERY